MSCIQRYSKVPVVVGPNQTEPVWGNARNTASRQTNGSNESLQHSAIEGHLEADIG